jgi:RNA polymerase sigma-70 factor (ECF subfamily)
MLVTLVEQARGGDHAAFTDLIDLEGDRCYAIAYRILRDRDRAADAVQQAWLTAWRELTTLRDPARFTAWLHRLLVHACYAEHRRRSRWNEQVAMLEDDAPAGFDPTRVVEVRDALERAFADLSAEHRAVVVLHHYAGLPLEDVALAVGAPVGTVKSRLHYGVRAMRSALANADRPVTGEVPA